jgi:hypothetical protein
MRNEQSGKLAAQVLIAEHNTPSQEWLRGLDLNQRSGYELDELTGCSTPRSALNLLASQALDKPRIARSERFVAILSPLFEGVFGANADQLTFPWDLRFR